ncbi:hypothetical protein V5799_010959 [Amblyomma americanum]|uniref:Uncharacterized protein n=1 Tax=Amblyomma americanum TaxID=6943 RepID=A0AAQ4EIP1_AMBAM
MSLRDLRRPSIFKGKLTNGGSQITKRAEMQLLTIFALLCLLGPTLSTHTRPSKIDVADRRARSATGTCHNGKEAYTALHI